MAYTLAGFLRWLQENQQEHDRIMAEATDEDGNIRVQFLEDGSIAVLKPDDGEGE